MSRKKTFTEELIEIDGHSVPLRIYREYRSSIRLAIGKEAILLRLPSFLTSDQRRQQISRARDWTHYQFEKHPGLRQRFSPRQYEEGDHLEVGQRLYHIKVSYDHHRSHRASLKGDLIQLRFSRHDQDGPSAREIRQLLSRVIGADHLPRITRRVHELNQQHFHRPLRKVSLKYNLSNWGSCSASGNINLSTRLLFAPAAVIDYVIIHELAHLAELNHSPRFWKLVEEAMPDFKEREIWLKKNGHLCDF